ncbi:MAG: iron-sulfur cluster assembly accessory protein [Proteobacteria bacterium]|jgi:iron-sulfur cluster assembly protein|nr:iron-sulfur cluster assembly accessory protein [Pseudomonadota bacterium]
MFTITPAAAEQIQKAAAEGQMTGMPLRVAARREEDGSVHYAMGFADDQTEADHVDDESGALVIIAPISFELLSDTTLDYVQLDNGEYNFVFLNPKDPNYTPPAK